MKTLIILFIFLLPAVTISQTVFTLRIIDTQGKPLTNVAVTAKNQEIVLKGTTDNTGKLVLTFTEPGTYQISYLDMANAIQCEVKEGFKATYSKTSTYDPTGVFAVEPNINRKNIVFQSRNAQELRSKPNTAKVTVIVKEKNGTKVLNQPIELISGVDKVKYQGKTNSSGMAIFYVPINQEYEIDIDGIEAIQKFKVGNYVNAELTEVVYFEKTKISEIAKGDTIKQNNITQSNGTSSHLLFTLHLKNYEGSPLPGEDVFVNAINSSKVYQGITDEAGTCRFMLEKGSDYLVNLKYEREICLVNATETKGFSSSMASRRYRGSAAIEKMLSARKVNQEGFVTNHDETPIRKASPEAGYLKTNTKGYELNFKNSGPIGTPTLAENKIYTQEGFHSPNFHCLDATNGSHIWGVELGESGISPAVYHNGILLINTYSCTLYAIDAGNGKLLWSKWLAGTIYSTPSADENSVYVVYNNGYENPVNPSENYVIASFDIKTGKENWMKWIDNEVIACPVVEGNEVHIASQSGNYYVFDKVNGKNLMSAKTIKAVSSPSLTSENIFISAMVNDKEQLIVLDRTTLKVVKKYPEAFQSIAVSKTAGSYGQMNYNGAHPVVYKNEVIVLLDGNNIFAFDARSEKLLWKKELKTHPNQTPIVANEKVIVAGMDGGIWSFDIRTGKGLIIEKTEDEIDGQPVSSKGFMFIAAAGVVRTIKSMHAVPWTQWNKNAGHNTVSE